jgi:hypothetical protein
MVWACGEAKENKAVRVVIKMNIEGKRERGKPKKR